MNVQTSVGQVNVGLVESIVKETPVKLPARSWTKKIYVPSEAISVPLEYGVPLSVAPEILVSLKVIVTPVV